tara:strand:- start:9838 stop:11916 length:2079 start_codon:yes stop_codon:yes gene_type:complete
LLLASNSVAGNLSKAFEALHIYNYFEAKRLFTKAIKKDSVGGSYGLSVIYSRNDNPFYQPDSALKYILIADSKIKKLEDKSKGKLFAVGIDEGEIGDQKQRVSEIFYQAALDSMNTATFDRFIKNHEWYKNKAQAILIRDSLAFDDATADGTWQGYEYFFTKYDQARQVPMARSKYDLLFFYDKTQNKTLVEYETFIRDFPKSPYVEEAQDHIYEIVTQSGTKDSYHNFIKKYPDNRNIEDAWKIIYQKSVKRNDPLEIANFILDYPDYPYRNDALMDYTLSNEKFYPVRIGSKWGFINKKAQEVIEPEYDWVEPFSEGSALVGKGGFSGYINKRGEVNVPIKYTDGGTFISGHSWVEMDGSYGLVNNHGVLVLNTSYEDVGSFSEKRIYAQKEGKYGYFDHKLNLVIPFLYSSASAFKNGRAIVELSGKKGVIGLEGDTVIELVYDQVIYNSDIKGYLLETENKQGILSLNGDTIVPFEYDQLGNIAEERILFVKEGSYGYLNFSGREVIEAKYSYNSLVRNYGSFKNGVVKYISKSKFGLVDSVGKKVYPAIFEDVGDYASITPVKKKGKWGFSNADVKLVIRYKYDFAEGFNYGLSRVQVAGKWGLINRKGGRILEIKYDALEYFGTNLLKVKLDNKWGLLDRNGQEVLELQNDEIKVHEKNVLLLTKDGKQAYYDLSKQTYLFKEQGY